MIAIHEWPLSQCGASDYGALPRYRCDHLLLGQHPRWARDLNWVSRGSEELGPL